MQQAAVTSVKPIYQHTQIGYVSLFVIAIVLGLYAWKFRRPAAYSSVDNVSSALSAYIPVVIAILIAMFATLTVKVTAQRVTWLFGPGLIRGKIGVSEIAQAREVRTSVLSGFGIRHTPSGVLYNVSGTHALELTLQDGRQIRIGTDDAQGFLTALREVGVKP